MLRALHPCATTAESRKPQKLCPQTRSHPREKPVPHDWRAAPAHCRQRRPTCRSEDAAQPEINQNIDSEDKPETRRKTFAKPVPDK